MACSSKAITDADLKSPFKGESDCMWLVGMDSSKLAFRCLRLATMLMDVKSSKHHLLVVSIVDDDQKEDLTLQANCQEEARRCGLLMKNYAFKTMKRPDKWTVGEALIYFANKAAGYKARLVIGAQGMRGGDASKGAQAMDRIGSIASDCMSKVKVPLIVVKQPWGDIDGQRNALGRVMRCGRNGVPGLTFMCCVDGSAISNQIFAFTTSLLRPDDRFVALHVRKVARDVDGQNREAMVCTYYKQECAKVAFTFKGLKGTSCESRAMEQLQRTMAVDFCEFSSVSLPLQSRCNHETATPSPKTYWTR